MINKPKGHEELRTIRSISPFIFLFLLIIFVATSSLSYGGNLDIPIVNPEKIYSSKPFYSGVNEAMEDLKIVHGDVVELEEIGKSVDGHPIIALHIGKGRENVLVLGGMHGREAITSVLILNQIEEILMAYISEDTYKYGGYQTKKILDDVSIWFVPLMNPDGAEISLNSGWGIDNKSLLKFAEYQKQSLGSWKANLNGVDLNRNFTSDKYGTVKNSGYAFYPGPAPFSEPETKAIVEFTREKKFVGALNIHAAGEIIYWDLPYQTIASRLSRTTGYSLVPPSNNYSMGSYDTWFLRETGNPVFTVEIGQGSLKAPMEFEKYNSLWKKNWLVPIVFARELQKSQRVAIFFEDNELQLIIPPIREASGQVFVPLREVMEKIGGQVQWNKESKTVSITIDDNIKEISQEGPAKLVRGTSYLPLRDLVETFGYCLEWDNYTKSARIYKTECEELQNEE